MKKRKYDKNELARYTQKDPNIKNYFNKEILLHLDSFCLGDTICFFSLVKRFLEFHNPTNLNVIESTMKWDAQDALIYFQASKVLTQYFLAQKEQMSATKESRQKW
jgi:hypothetical protein